MDKRVQEILIIGLIMILLGGIVTYIRTTYFSEKILNGKIINDAGNPIQGVTIGIDISRPQRYGIWNKSGIWIGFHPISTTTNEKGEFLFEKLDRRHKISISAIQKDGYQFQAGGTIKKDSNGNFSVEDITMVRLSRVLTGSVLDNKGEPAVGAIVFVFNQGIDPNWRTNELGHFELFNLPQGEIWIGAMRGEKEYSCLKVFPNDKEVVLKLMPIPEKSQVTLTIQEKKLVVEIIEEAWGNEFYTRNYLPAMLARIDVDRAIEMATISNNEDVFDSLILATPLLSSEEADKIIEAVGNKLSPTHRAFIFSYLAVAYSKSDLSRSKVYFEQVMKSQSRAGCFFLNMALAAKRLGYQNWQSLAKKAFTKAQSTKDDDWKRALCGDLGLLDSEQAEEIAETIKDWNTRQSARAEIVINMASEDVIKAHELYEAIPQPKGKEEDLYISMAGKKVVYWMCKENLKEALEIAKKVVKPEHRAEALAIVADATVDIEEAEEIYYMALTAARESKTLADFELNPEPATQEIYDMVFPITTKQSPISCTAVLPKVIKSMRFRYPDKVLAIVEKRIVEIGKSENSSREILEMAYYIADIAPNKARSIIENEIYKVISKGNLTSNSQFSLQKTAMAMVRIDTTRSIQIAQGLPTSSLINPDINYRAETLRKLAQYLLATEEIRRNLAFDRWCASDTWTPGEETNW